MTETERRPQLDGVRGLAVLSVLLFHTWRMPFVRGHGVTVFFVLSGYLITGILLRSRGFEGAFRTFYLRRVLRIFPIYYLLLVAGFAVGIPVLRDTIAWHLSYFSNVDVALHGWRGMPVDHLWSLAVEEQFYLFWPVLMLTLPAVGLPWLIGAAVLCGPLTRWIIFAKTGDAVTATVLTPAFLDALAAGAWMACRPLSVRAARIAGIAGAALAVLCAVLGSATGAGLVLQYDAVILIAMWLIRGAAAGFSGAFGRLLASRPLVALGTVSYGVYLYHPFIWVGLIRLGVHGIGPAQFAMVTTVTLLVAALSWRLIETPLNGLKRHFPYRGRRRAATASGVAAAAAAA